MSGEENTISSSSTSASVSSKSSNKRELNEDKENDGDVCSLQDVIDCEKERNEIASAVLAASDPTNCSYDEGSVYRQALYCCITCLKEKQLTFKQSNDSSSLPSVAAATDEDEANFLHGICLACSYECHQNHELYELYTKRDFRCDCGNSKFNINGKVQPCKLQPNKDSLNSSNKYNHNFKGLYCTCNRPYPETSINDSSNELNSSNNANNTNANCEENSEEMIQCTICEDWFHSNHLNGFDSFPANDNEYEEMICHMCMSNNKYLWYYQGYIALKSDNKLAQSSHTNETVDSTNERTIDVLNSSTADKEDTQNISECFLKKCQIKYENLNIDVNKACCFLIGWREALCRCVDCMQIYKRNNVEFLLRPNDTIKYYEEQGKKKEAETQSLDENKLLNDQLSKLNRVSRIEFLHNVNDFKQELKDFLGNFAANGQIVKRENILQFFEELNQRKKRKIEEFNDQLSGYYCK